MVRWFKWVECVQMRVALTPSGFIAGETILHSADINCRGNRTNVCSHSLIERSDPDVPERLSELPETDEEEREGIDDMGDFAEWTLNDRPRMIVLAFLIFPAADPLPTPKSSNIASILLGSLAP